MIARVRDHHALARRVNRKVPGIEKLSPGSAALAPSIEVLAGPGEDHDAVIVFVHYEDVSRDGMDRNARRLRQFAITWALLSKNPFHRAIRIEDLEENGILI